MSKAVLKFLVVFVFLIHTENSETLDADKKSGKPVHNLNCPKQSWIDSPYSIVVLTIGAIVLVILAMIICISFLQKRFLYEKLIHKDVQIVRLNDQLRCLNDQLRCLNDQFNINDEKHQRLILAYEELRLLHEQNLNKEASKSPFQKVADIFLAKRMPSSDNDQLVASTQSKAIQSSNLISNALLSLHYNVNNYKNP